MKTSHTQSLIAVTLFILSIVAAFHREYVVTGILVLMALLYVISASNHDKEGL